MKPVDYLKKYQISDSDLEELETRGITQKKLQSQLRRYNEGYPSLAISGVPQVGDGICRIDQAELSTFESNYSKAVGELKLCKFVPASGAASRMFRDLLISANHSHIKLVRDRFLSNLEKFAFYPLLNSGTNHKDDLSFQDEFELTLKRLLEHLNYQNLPKALIAFHRYGNEVRTALEEHLVEATAYLVKTDKVRIHFTVARQHQTDFNQFLRKIVPKYQTQYKTDFEVTTSIQSPSTDMLALDTHHNVLRGNDGNLVLRPGGHGALLENLNQLDADIIFIKNVDNVAPDHLKPQMIRYKKALVGLLLNSQAKIYRYIQKLKKGPLDKSIEIELTEYFQHGMGVKLGPSYHHLSTSARKDHLINYLNRPIRVCSVIKSKKPTGGGPYWVQNGFGDSTLQVIEHAQLGLEAMKHEANYAHITDLVCGVRDYQDRKFDLIKFVDPDCGFITDKNYKGRPILAQELPGLWNGSMAQWNTLMLEVPDTIFHPVKTVWDLLSPDHQPKPRV